MGEDALETFIEGLRQLGIDTHGAEGRRSPPLRRVPHPRVPARGTPTIYEGREPGVYRLSPPPRVPARGTPTIYEGLVEQFLRYRQELLDWNTRINLTAITDPEEVLIKHFLDSLSLLSVYDKPRARLLDIGSGAGFPGLPLKIVRPQWQVVLLEATRKKVTFLQHMIETLQLKDIVAVHGRAEELAHKAAYRAAFDVVTARAVASLPALLEYAAPFCRVGGKIILSKKGELMEELDQGERAAKEVGAVLKANVAITLPGLADGRRLLVWEQQKLCPPQFPRAGAVMAKKPLG